MAPSAASPSQASQLYQKVNEHYSSLASTNTDDETTAQHTQKVALSFGYSAHELAAIPEGANLGVSCGNPLAVAGLKEGETVIDLGSGAGFDVFLAARKVGEKGMAIGVDMSKDMLARARANATKSSITNVKFVESPITAIDLPSSSADCIISNCVINLVPAEDKYLVFQDIFRLLKSGGRVAVSDILAKKQLTPDLQRDMALYVGCISGASLVKEYENWLKETGFKDILIVDRKNDLNIYKEDNRKFENEQKENASSCCNKEAKPAPKVDNGSCCSRNDQVAEGEARVINEVDFNEWVGSYSIYAVKP